MKIKSTTLLKRILFLFLFAYSCSTPKLQISDATAITNYGVDDTLKLIDMDYTDAIDSGFIIPSIKQTSSGKFTFSFTITNNSESEDLIYKLFYQNETYKFPELVNGKYNELSAENFYGSWEDINYKKIRVRKGESLVVNDSLRIVGNPRNEDELFSTAEHIILSEKQVTDKIIFIKTQKDWFADITKKALKEGRSVDEQLKLDAIYVINEDLKGKKFNQRWKRNPRTGTYGFYVLVLPANEILLVPKYILNLSLKQEKKYINPFYFLNNNLPPTCAFTTFPEKLMVKAVPDLGSGIYIDTREMKMPVDNNYYSSTCGENYDIYHNAQFQQYFHHLGDNFPSPNIPLAKDVQSDELTLDNYNNFTFNYPVSSLLPSTNVASRCPCENVYSDSTAKKIVLKNPGFRRNLMEKENTGVFSRHGLTYGKYTFKVKLPQLLNKNKFWNGLTNAIWLIDQSNDEWNRRRTCNGNGYIPKEITAAENALRKPQVSYTEIDFEIRKGSPVWPVTSYPKGSERPAVSNNSDDSIVVLCTNWDLACNAPSNFNSGARPFNGNNATYLLHRWTHWYQALSSKYIASDDELFAGDYYYFQIDWKPASITWRIGPEYSKLREVCYMDSSVTSIPNNQMLMVITQEYHISEWWPESPYLQEYIPIPLKNIEGEILEIKVE